MNNSPNAQLSIEEYNKKQQETTLILFKIIIFLLGITNSFIIVFFFIFGYHISTIKATNMYVSGDLDKKEKDNYINDKIINKKLVALYTASQVFHNEYLQIIKNEEEYNRLMNWLETTYSQAYLCYSNTANSGFNYDPFHFCKYNMGLIFMFRTYEGNRFGAAIFNFAYENFEFIEDRNAFLFNLDTNKIFEVKNAKHAYSFQKDIDRLVFGDEDLVIDFYFQTQRIYSKFPRNYGNSNNTLYDLIGEEAINGQLSINGLEIIGKYQI